ncbi:hypothetical protein IPA_09675 [Ignicoccus pacificus DSM 13166]|uniref:NurA domain-containing protein n=1 Tax=Ignicoccus pacificus DSM 13166 TaxID=940294 RepID=A0A977KC57_9CREN|nr:hypothetical protein IPA_09675 [Ignicoccus pacificus DSM 13166]
MDKFNELWNSMDITERSDGIPVAAIDGSVNRKKLHAATVFAVRAVVIKIPKGSTEETPKKEKMGILRFPQFWRERTIMYMEGLEAELYSDFTEANPTFFMMMDGMFSVASKCHADLSAYGCTPFKGTLDELLVRVRNTNDVAEAIRVECGWKKEMYKEVARIARKVPTVYVGKSFMDNSVFNDPEIYDIEIIDVLAKTPGFTKPFIQELEVGCSPQETVTISRSYMKFSKRGSVYVVEVLGNVNEDEMEEIFKILIYYSVKGYPLPLKLAHRRCEISDRYFNVLLRRAGGGLLRTGREAL